ncbi:MAG: chemotaxis protein CheW [Bacteroidales bacterium]|nr:chemotaxis protein CheW [Bacteroidales bacterium]
MINNQNNTTYLSFYIGNELLGADVSYILEVLLNEPVTAIPRTEDFIVGVLNFRGEIVTVIDFADKLNLPIPESKKSSIVVVVELFKEDKAIKIGLKVDQVRKVFEVPGNELKEVPEFGKYYNPEFLMGVAKTNDGLVTLLDLEKILNEKEVQLITNTNK